MNVATIRIEDKSGITRYLIRGPWKPALWFVQTDWEYPALARALGWRGKVGREKCEHRSTDGTVKCRECGREAGAFISAARDYLDANIGRCFRVNDDFPG